MLHVDHIKGDTPVGRVCQCLYPAGQLRLPAVGRLEWSARRQCRHTIPGRTTERQRRRPNNLTYLPEPLYLLALLVVCPQSGQGHTVTPSGKLTNQIVGTDSYAVWDIRDNEENSHGRAWAE